MLSLTGVESRSVRLSGMGGRHQVSECVHRVDLRAIDPLLVLLELSRVRHSLKVSSPGAASSILTRETLVRLDVPVIPFAEQQRIADCLSSLDTKYRRAYSKVATLKVHKQGLLQQLFPSPEGSES